MGRYLLLAPRYACCTSSSLERTDDRTRKQVQADGEPREALKAYSGTTLQITGNSTTLARWDARLGPFLHPLPPVASLRSLTPDGGVAALVDVVVERLHPVGFIETLQDGTRLAPVNESENRQAEALWEVRMRLLLVDSIRSTAY